MRIPILFYLRLTRLRNYSVVSLLCPIYYTLYRSYSQRTNERNLE